MKPARTIARFFLLLGFSYTLLMLPWPGLRPTYAAVFRDGCQMSMGSFGRGGSVQFVTAKKDGSTFDTVLIYLNRKTGVRIREIISSSRMGYAPAAFFIALLIATPLPLRRRVGALLWGTLLLQAVVGLILFLHITFVFGSNPQIATFSLGEFSQRLLRDLMRLVLFAPFFVLVVPIFIWILVTFRREDLARLLPQSALPKKGSKRLGEHLGNSSKTRSCQATERSGGYPG